MLRVIHEAKTLKRTAPLTVALGLTAVLSSACHETPADTRSRGAVPVYTTLQKCIQDIRAHRQSVTISDPITAKLPEQQLCLPIEQLPAFKGEYSNGHVLGPPILRHHGWTSGLTEDWNQINITYAPGPVPENHVPVAAPEAEQQHIVQFAPISRGDGGMQNPINVFPGGVE